MPSKGGKAAAAPAPISGADSTGKTYNNVDEMWKHELRNDVDDKQKGWYGKALSYWEKQEASINGVLGGLPEVHDADIRESRAFVEAMPPGAPSCLPDAPPAPLGRKRALDCGAGIGRISKELLCPMFETVDLMEPIAHMCDKAREELSGLTNPDGTPKLGEIMMTSMQKAVLTPGAYDIIWIQWAAIYLTDDDFATFLSHCQKALNPAGGVIVFKENVSTGQHFIVDKDDSSLTRSDEHYKRIFAKGGVKVVTETRQKEWPDNLFPIGIYALR